MRRIIDSYVEPKPKSSLSQVTYTQRQILEECVKKRMPNKDTCVKVGITRSTLYYEKLRCPGQYNAKVAQEDAERKTQIRMRCGEIPETHKKSIKKVYREILDVMKEAMSSKTKLALKKCLAELERMGADPNKVKKPITEGEITKILKMHNVGKSYTEIEALTGRSRTSIAEIIKREKNKQQNLEENEYDRLKNRWLN